ncbi:hypothetical protein P9597_28480 [Aneurinibacillus migulanus]|uniref:hypothetical protein n=1 Tax=Aneurinibacillus migulanus TaxID=47500 RepID=UPI002E1BC44B|nr:hypothetical protein [Aneurinibacillus migulanus]
MNQLSNHIIEGKNFTAAQEGVRIWRNTSEENLYFICIQAKEGTLEGSTIDDGVVINKPIMWSNE